MTPLQALQKTLAGEHAAVYVYGVVGGRVSDSSQPTLAAEVTSAYGVHRTRRDQLRGMVRAHGGDPVASAVSYGLPNACVTPQELRTAARVTEERCAAGYAEAVGSTSRSDRAWLVAALSDSAVRLLALGDRPESWPGVPEL